MYKTWTGFADDAPTVARDLEAHLNEYAGEVVSVAYAVSDLHYVLAVYREVDAGHEASHEAAVSIAEQIIDHAKG